MRELIDRGGRKPVTRTETSDKAWREQHRAVVVNSGVPKICTDRVAAMLCIHAFEVLRYFIERFVPADALPAVRGATNRIFQPVFVVMYVLQRDCLRTDIAAAKRVIFVAADGEPLVSFDFDLDTTNRFAQITARWIPGNSPSQCNATLKTG